MNAGLAREIPPAQLISRYEKLRSGALGQPVELGARGGLGLLLSRGLWKWAQLIAPEPTKPDAYLLA
jgi:hypothetical protein